MRRRAAKIHDLAIVAMDVRLRLSDRIIAGSLRFPVAVMQFKY
jgi:hypothetical protein